MANFKVKPHYLIPVLVVLGFSTIFALLLSNVYGSPPLVLTPFTEAGFGPMLNALYFSALVGFGGIFIYIFSGFG